MHRLPVLLLWSITWCYVLGQIYTISTFEGGLPPDNIAGTSAGLGAVQAVAVESAGNVFLMTDILEKS